MYLLMFTAKSPVFSHVGATLNGLTTIRSHGKNVQLMLQKEFDDYQDIHSGAWYLVIATESAFGFILDLVCCIFIGCVCFSFILMDSGMKLFPLITNFIFTIDPIKINKFFINCF